MSETDKEDSTTDRFNEYPDRVIGPVELEKVIPYTARHVKRLEATGDFPPRIRLGAGRCGWWLSEVLAWAKSKPRHQPKTAA